MKTLLVFGILAAMSGCFGSGSTAPSPTPSSAASNPLKSCDVLPDGGGANCNWTDGQVTHHSDCAHCGKM